LPRLSRTIPLTLERQLTIEADRLRLDDVLRPAGALAIDRVAVTDQPTMHSPSARQDGSTSITLGADAASAVCAALRAGRAVTVRWTVLLDTGQAEVHVTT